MEYPLIAVNVILLLTVAALLIKIRLIRKSVSEITEAFSDRLSSDTNTLIDISSRDPYMLRLASEINVRLRLLRAERHRFRQGDRELREAVTNLSHDLRTPLTAINGYLGLLDREEKSEAVNNYLLRIRNRADALTDLTEELFRYSIAASVERLSLERLDLVGILEESLLSFYGLFTERGIEPSITLPDGQVFRELDKSAVMRVLSNIIANAIKYSDGDLTVTMTGDGMITFTNCAKGLDQVAVGRLFDRFYTVEAARSSTGLGLSIARLLTERMGGSIEAEYDSGRLKIFVMFGQS